MMNCDSEFIVRCGIIFPQCSMYSTINIAIAIAVHKKYTFTKNTLYKCKYNFGLVIVGYNGLP